MLRDRLQARLAEMSGTPDYVALAAEVLGIRNAPPALAKRLVDQALVVEDRRAVWLETGQRIIASAPACPGVYVLRDREGRAIYVGKANNIRRRLQAHFAPRQWKRLKAEFVRAHAVTWTEVGSEIEALLLEAQLIRDEAPPTNVQVSAPALDTRAVPASLVRDALLVLPSAVDGHAELLAVRAIGPVFQARVARDGAGLAARVARLRRFFAGDTLDERAGDVRRLEAHAPLVFSWMAGRGQAVTRLDPHDARSGRELERRLKMILDDDQLFNERIIVLRSVVRSTQSPRALSSAG